MKKKLNLLEIQQCLLRCMQSIDQCCRENGILYSLNWGSLLGAVRHKGFIPWDDDMDLLMTRENYNTFIKSYNNPDYEIISENTRYWGSHFIRICDKKTLVEWNEVYNLKCVSHGLWIAIFPIDNAPSDENKWNKLQRNYFFYEKCIYLKNGMWTSTGIIRNIIKASVRICLLPFSEKFLIKQQRKVLTKYNKTKTGLSFQKCNYFHQYPSYFFNKYIDLEFDGNMFMAISDYDAYLTTAYGDYMTPPPLEKRIPKHDYIAYEIDSH